MKRAFDLIIALPLAIFLAPVLAVISAAILLTDGPPVLFRQTRVGLGKSKFQILKFRTMRHNPAASAGDAPEGANLEQLKKLREGYQTTAEGDRRVTAVGRLLRRTSLDELPQVFNVIRGEMSLVGPRPDTPVQEADCSPEVWTERHRVRPGITGLAQVSGRSSISREERDRLDVEYARTASVWLDLRILARTAVAVFQQRGSA